MGVAPGYRAKAGNPEWSTIPLRRKQHRGGGSDAEMGAEDQSEEGKSVPHHVSAGPASCALSSTAAPLDPCQWGQTSRGVCYSMKFNTICPHVMCFSEKQPKAPALPYPSGHNPELQLEVEGWGDFPGPVVTTSPSNAGGASSTPGWGAKITHGSWSKNQKRKTEAVS